MYFSCVHRYNKRLKLDVIECYRLHSTQITSVIRLQAAFPSWIANEFMAIEGGADCMERATPIVLLIKTSTLIFARTH